jgi:polyhydroxybutyrate depolymerase
MRGKQWSGTQPLGEGLTMKDRHSRLRVIALLAAIACTCPGRAETISIAGVTRSFTVALPPVRPAPLVIVLHGAAQSGADMMTRTAWPQVAREGHFGVVFPDGLGHGWADLRPNTRRVLFGPPKGTDDVAFITQLIDKFVRDGSADPRRIYVTGVSNGGAMAMTMVCARADLFAAAASVIFNFGDEAAQACHPSRAVPMLMMNGTADPIVPYEGGQGSSRFAAGGFWSTEQTLAFWRQTNQCEGADAEATELDDRDPDDQSTVTRITSNCPAGHDVVLYRINGGGHRMPGRIPDARFPRMVTYMLGPQNRDVDGAEVIWDFFKRFP